MVSFLFLASTLLPAILDVAVKVEPINVDHLKLLVTKQLETLDLSYIVQKNPQAAIEVLDTAAVRQLVGFNMIFLLFALYIYC